MTIHLIGAPVASGMAQRLRPAMAMAAQGEGPDKPFTLAEKGVSPAKLPEGVRCPTGAEIMAEEAERARMNLDVLLGSQANREAEVQRTQRLAAAVRARGSDAAPLTEDIAHHRAEIEALRPQIEAAHKEYAAAMDRLRQYQPGGREVVSASA